MKMPRRLALLMPAFFAIPSIAFSAAPLHVAVAANFTAPIKAIIAHFEKTTGQTVLPSFGATGMLYAQIRNGAPFALFLSADSRRPRLLAEQGLAVPSSRYTYAIGRLVLWSPRPGEFSDGATVLHTRSFSRLAIADPTAAPYGAAAKQVLEKLRLWHHLSPRIVRGQSLTQTYQYVASGNAQLGFIALSQIALLPIKDKGSQWLVPQSLYQPIRQQDVLLKRSAHNPEALSFYRYLKSAQAKSIIRQYGYEIAQ